MPPYSLTEEPFTLDPALELGPGPVTPELIQPGNFVSQAEAGSQPGFQQGEDKTGSILRALAEFVAQSPLTSPEARGPILQTLQKQREKVRQDRASKQLQFVTGHLSEAFGSGDADRVSKAIKEMTKLENMEPEVAQVVSKMGLSFSEQLGKVASARDEQKKQSQAVADSLEAVKMGASRVDVAQMLARRGVDPKMIDEIAKLLPEPKGIEFTTLPPLVKEGIGAFSTKSGLDLQSAFSRYTAGQPEASKFVSDFVSGRTTKEGLAARPLKDKVVSAISIPEGKQVPLDLAADLGRFGIDANDKAQLKSVQKELAEPSLGVQLANLGLNRERFERIPPQDRRMLSESRASFNQLDKISQLYQQTDAFKTGKISSVLKSGIATNQTVRFLSEVNLLPAGKLTGAELDFSNAYNALLIKLRSFSGDPRFSDQDALRTIQGLGNGLLGKNFPRQLAAAQDFIGEIYNSTLEDLSATGFDTGKIRGLERVLSKEEAAKLLVEAGGELDKARSLAKKRGFKF